MGREKIGGNGYQLNSPLLIFSFNGHFTLESFFFSFHFFFSYCFSFTHRSYSHTNTFLPPTILTIYKKKLSEMFFGFVLFLFLSQTFRQFHLSLSKCSHVLERTIQQKWCGRTNKLSSITFSHYKIFSFLFTIWQWQLNFDKNSVFTEQFFRSF